MLQPLMEGLQAVGVHLENRLDTPVRATLARVRAEVAAQDKAKDAPREPQSPSSRK